MNKYSIGVIPSEVMVKIAANHKALRKQKGLTQVQLSDLSGVSLGSLKRFERTGKVAFESLLQLASALRRLEEFTALLEPGVDMKRIERLFDEA